MKSKYSLLLLALLVLLNINTGTSQVSINTTGATPDSSAMLDITSEEAGMLIPRMVEAQRLAISSPATGLLLYQTNGLEGFYYWDGVRWLFLTASDGQGWSQTWQIYGEMFENSISTYIPLDVNNVFYPWTSASQGDFSGTGYVTFEDNSQGDRINIGASGGGIYLINVSVSCYGANNMFLTGAVFLNNVISDDLKFASTISGNDLTSASMSGIITLSPGDYVHFAFSSQANAHFVNLYYMNVSLSRISML